jgi:peptide/nickel transport system substrate-binding protein
MRIVKWAAHAAAAATLALLPAIASAQTLKVVMHSDVKIIDPFWTTAYIARNYGYMVYDTLLAVDDKLQINRRCWKAGRLATTSSPIPSPCATG